MSKHYTYSQGAPAPESNQTTTPMESSPTVADSLAAFHSLNLPETSVNMQPLDDETLAALRRINGYVDPRPLSGQLASALRTLWAARQSGELADEDADSTIWLLAEVSSLLEHAAVAHSEAMWWESEHEKAIARTGKEKATEGRRACKEGQE